MALTKFNYNSFDVTPVASSTLAFNSGANGLTAMSPGAMTLIKTVTASDDSTISFVNGASDVVLDSTYPIYIVKVISANIATDNQDLVINFSDDTSSHAYNLTKTDLYFAGLHTEADNDAGLQYETGEDIAQGTGFTVVTKEQANDADAGACSTIWLFNPSSTTFVKHYMMRSNWFQHNDYAQDAFKGGYINTTAAVTAIQFKSTSGNIDSGTFKLYGIKDS